MLEKADVVAMYFEPEALALIGSLEFGLFVRSRGQGNIKMVVACPEGFSRRGNVQVICQRFGIECLGSMEELTNAVLTRLGSWAEGGGGDC